MTVFQSIVVETWLQLKKCRFLQGSRTKRQKDQNTNRKKCRRKVQVADWMVVLWSQLQQTDWHGAGLGLPQTGGRYLAFLPTCQDGDYQPGKDGHQLHTERTTENTKDKMEK